MKNINVISILVLITFLFKGVNLNAQVAINGDGSAPNASAMLDVQSTDKGILIPRVASTASIATPVNGLLVYSTADNSFNYYDGTSWKKVSTASSQWTTSGSNIYYNTGGVAIGGGTVTSSAILDLQSTDKGILIPRIANNNSVTSPVAGLLIYNTTDKAFYYYDGSGWKMINNQWNTSGSDVYYNSGGVTIGGTNKDASAILDIQSTTKGVLIPRMATAQMTAISSPSAGLMVYNTTLGSLYYYNGGWVKIATGNLSSQWVSNGNDVYYNTGGVTIGGSSTTSSAILDLQSTTKGILIPRMSQVQRTGISGPVKGLIVYQTDGTEGFYYYTGSAWNMLFSLTSGSYMTVSQGGTGIGTISANQILIGNETASAFKQSPNLTFKEDTLKVAGTLINNGNSKLNGGISEKIEVLSSGRNLTPDDHIIICPSGNTITLPTVNPQNKGLVYIIKNKDLGGTGSLNIVPGNELNTIDGLGSISLKPYESIKIVSDGDYAWYILSSYNGSL